MHQVQHDPFPSEVRPQHRIGRAGGGAGRPWVESWTGRSKLALLALFVWTAVGLFQTVPSTLIEGYSWDHFLAKLIEAWTWALLTPAILLIDRKLSSVEKSIVRLSAYHLALSVPFSLIHAYLAGLFEYPIPEIWWNPLRSKEYIMYYFLGNWVTYCAVIGVLRTFKYHNRILESQVELERVGNRLLETRLNALRLQLEPHFLFNTLNAISSEVAANPAMARDMIEDLGSLLRSSLECQESNEITLAEELALLDRYLAIQRLRFGDRITIRIDVHSGALATKVPSMLLQPLVENAIRHGLERGVSGGKVSVSARHEGRRLRIEVVDDGLGLPPRWNMESCAGLGLRVTRERLEALYSGVGDYGFTVARRRGGGTKVVIHIPLHGSGADVPHAVA